MNMTKRQVIDRHGNEIELDDDAILPDGCRMRVPLILRDGETVDGVRAIADQQRLDALSRDAARVQAYADEFTRQREQREREARSDPGHAAYLDYCERLQRGSMGVAA